MQHLGSTRSVLKSTHLVQTEDTFVRIRLPGMDKGLAIVHASPAVGAGFAQYTAEIEEGGRLGPTGLQRFFYVLAGAVVVRGGDDERWLKAGGFAYLPQGSEATVSAKEASRLAVIEKAYLAIPDHAPPGRLFGDEVESAPQPLMGDSALLVRSLLPDIPAFDFAVNTMEYLPGASLPLVEMHVMEHGLLMLQGGGIYRLADDWYPVRAGDFIWMAPYCPQWFGALGKTPAKYLIYKDWNRHP